MLTARLCVESRMADTYWKGPLQMNTHRFFRAAGGFVVIFLLAGCATTIRTDYNREVAFGQLRTYELVDHYAGTNGDEPLISPLLERHIVNAVDGELESRGYERANSGTADFRISYRVVTAEGARVDPGFGYSPGFGHSPFRGGFGHSPGFRRGFGHSPFFHDHHGAFFGATTVTEFLRSTLILDVFDARSGELIWRGWARTDLPENPRPERFQMYVRQAVHKILKRFPPNA